MVGYGIGWGMMGRHWPMHFDFGLVFFWIILIIILEIILKALALWKSARHNQSAWFVVLVVFNPAGILPLIYLIFFQQDREEVTTPTTPVRRRNRTRGR